MVDIAIVYVIEEGNGAGFEGPVADVAALIVLNLQMTVVPTCLQIFEGCVPLGAVLL